MLEKIPEAVGRALGGTRAGLEDVTLHQVEAPSGIVVTSPAFAPDATMPARFTADGEGMSPPLRWTGVPQGTKAVVLLVEDADSPTPHPLVHAILPGLPGTDGDLDEGAMPGPGHDGDVAAGRNSFLRAGWLPPDPPPGHGPHRYVFQVFALDVVPEAGAAPGRGALVAMMTGHVLAKGAMIGVYGRGAG
jgi:Raf kinase inhibitor-like YbhB/YbcL family protein